MKQNSYHHGNLKEELIQAGLKIINEEGEEHLSLRKAATLCQVSHAAPKSHFNSKEEFVEEIKQYVTAEFTKSMEDVILKNEDKNKLIQEFGLAYIKYFMKHPDSYLFVTSQKDIEIKVSKDLIYDSNYAPFQIFQKNASEVLLKKGFAKQSIPHRIIALWAIVNGLTGIYIMKGFHYEGDFMEIAKSILNEDVEDNVCY